MSAPKPSSDDYVRIATEIDAADLRLQFRHFTTQTAWELGLRLRTALLAYENPCVVDITLADSKHCLFHCTTREGTVPDQDLWVSRKRNVVLRFGCSSWSMHNRMGGEESRFASTFQLCETARDYAMHGGGWPVRVKGVSGIVAVIVVSGLEQELDHSTITSVVQEMQYAEQP